MTCRRFLRLPLLPFVLVLALSACRNNAPVDVIGSPGTAEDWQCEPAPEGGWACQRQGNAAAAPTAPSAAPRTTRAERAGDSDRPPPQAAPAAVPPPTAPPEASPASLPVVPDEPDAAAQAFAGVPATHYAVQLIAFGSAQARRDFVAKQRLTDVVPVQVESGGRLHFALLAGTYPSRAAAERAVAALPSALRALEPWIRSVGNLREAMARAGRASSPSD